MPINHTHVLFIDDGMQRPYSRCDPDLSGDKEFYVNCFSRALMIKVDLEAGTFGVAWQFVPSGGRDAGDDAAAASDGRADDAAAASDGRADDAAAASDGRVDDDRDDDELFNQSGGSVVPLENGHYLITFGNVRPSTGAMERGVYTRVFEVDKAGSVHSEARVPQNAISDNTYRTLPKASVGGETREPPFALGES